MTEQGAPEPPAATEEETNEKDRAIDQLRAEYRKERGF